MQRTSPPRRHAIFPAAFSCLIYMSLLSYPLLARIVPEKLSQANVYYEEAETARMALQQIPANQRTLKDYNHVILAFRKVYATAPASSRNPKSLMAIGELYQTMAFNMKDEKYLASAVRSYDFLLQEYPHSLFRAEAMLAAARIFQSDLRQPEEARKRYENFLQAFPNSPDREIARLGIAQIDAGVGTAKKKEPENPVANETKVAATQSNGKATVALSESRNSSETKIEAAALNSAQKRANDAAQTKAIRDTVEQPPAQAQQVSTLPRLPRNDTPIKARPAAQDQPKISEESRLGNPPQAQGQIESPAPEHESLNAEQTKEHTAVTDVRAWSTPASTRVVIDVGQVVRHEVGRLDNPPRIYLDLYGARIHRTVSRTISKKNPVTDGGLVKGLRAAQYQPDVTRIVAEVAQRTEYSDRKSTRLNSSHIQKSRMPSSA